LECVEFIDVTAKHHLSCKNSELANELELLNNMDTEEIRIDCENNPRFHPNYFLKVIAFDLDKTMVRTISLRTNEQPQPEQFENGYFMFYDDTTVEFHHVYKRPYLTELLHFLQVVVKEQFHTRLIMCTHGTEKYAQTILKKCGASDLFEVYIHSLLLCLFCYLLPFFSCECNIDKQKDVLMIDDDPGVYGRADRCHGSLLHIKPFEDPVIQKDDKEMHKLIQCLHDILKHGKNYYNLLLCNSIAYTGLVNEYTVAGSRRRRQQEQEQKKTTQINETLQSQLQSLNHSDYKNQLPSSDLSTENSLILGHNEIKNKDSLLKAVYLRDRLFLHHLRLRLKVLWCLRKEFAIEISPKEWLGTLYLFDRFHSEKKIDWKKAELNFSLHEFIILMFGCLFIARQYLFPDNKRPKQFRRDPYTCKLWLYHVKLYQEIITRLTEERIHFLKKLQLQWQQIQLKNQRSYAPKYVNLDADVDIDDDDNYSNNNDNEDDDGNDNRAKKQHWDDPSNNTLLDQYQQALKSLHYPIPLRHQQYGHNSLASAADYSTFSITQACLSKSSDISQSELMDIQSTLPIPIPTSNNVNDYSNHHISYLFVCPSVFIIAIAYTHI
ncbi:hypothetical protein RFI_15092, partial [Reticulomyxa filosa]